MTEEETTKWQWYFKRVVLVIAAVQVCVIIVWITIAQPDIAHYTPSLSVFYTRIWNSSEPLAVEHRGPTRIHVYNYHSSFLSSPSILCRACQDDCYVTTGPDTYMNSTIVLFLAPRLSSNKPPKKYPGQVWIFFGQESPYHHSTGFSQWKNLFNWTFTYRRDSDILAMYGGLEHIRTRDAGRNTVNNTTMLMKSTTAKISWLVSNCGTPSKRKQYVAKLAENKQLSIDIYGGCGQHKCPKSTDTSCMNFMGKKYNFYLSFENSFCFDYITEKSFKIYSNTGHLVPIVRGVGEYYSMFLPPNSYINAHKYASIKHLQADVIKISQNETRYKRFFEWRKHYRNLPVNTVHFCGIGKRTRQKDWQIKYKRLYEDIDTWLKGVPSEPFCKSPTDLR